VKLRFAEGLSKTTFKKSDGIDQKVLRLAERNNSRGVNISEISLSFVHVICDHFNLPGMFVTSPINCRWVFDGELYQKLFWIVQR